ncbi:MAG TPA: alpha/beta hydrolase, partial [Cellvibrionaceae bacterium]
AEGGNLDFVINDINFYNMIISGMYSWDLAIQVPQLIDDLYAGNITDRVEVFASYHVDWILDTSFSDVVFFMVDCHDSGHYSEIDLHNAIQQVPLLADMYSEWAKYDTCPKVPGLRAGNDFRMPVYSDVPTLLLSGELDPVTPPMWGRMVADTLTAGRHRVLREIGHGVAYSSVCGQNIMRAFWSDPLAEPANCSAWEEHPDYQ